MKELVRKPLGCYSYRTSSMTDLNASLWLLIFLCLLRGQLLFCCFLDLLTRSSLPPSNKSTVPRFCLLPAGELSLRRVFSFSASPESLLYQFHSFLLIIKEKNLTNLQTQKGEKIYPACTWQECRAGINNNAKDFTWTSLEVLWCLRIYLLISALSDFFNWYIYHFILFCWHAKSWGKISV